MNVKGQLTGDVVWRRQLTNIQSLKIVNELDWLQLVSSLSRPQRIPKAVIV